MPVVVADEKAVQILFAARCNIGHELLRGFSGLFGGNHDGRAVRVVRAHEIHLMAQHALRAQPDIGLDVFHDVADVKRAIGIRQGGGDEYAARVHGCICRQLKKSH